MSKNKKFLFSLFVITGAILFFSKYSKKSNQMTSQKAQSKKGYRNVSSVPKKKVVYKSKLHKTHKKLLPTIPVSTYKNEQRLIHRKITSASKIKKIDKKSFQTVGDYLILKDYFAVVDNEDNRLRFKDFESKLGYLIVRGEEIPMDSLTVTQNKDSGALGIMTGIITVKLTDFSNYQNTIEHSNFSISKVYDHIRVVHFKIDSSELAISTYKNLKGHPNVERVNLEILEYSRFHR